MTTTLELRNAEVTYGGIVALRGVSLSVSSSEVVAVLGPNGAGKTTIVRAITGLLQLQRGRLRSGTVSLDGVVLRQGRPAAAVKAGIAHVPEGRKLFSTLSVEENLRCGAATRTDKRVIEDDLAQIFDMFPIVGTRRKQTAGLLSGGEQQMVAIGRALMARPKILVCDEVSLGLAPKVVTQLLATLKTISIEQHIGVLIIEQNAHLALEVSARAYVLELGSIILQGRSQDLLSDRRVQDLYLGGGARTGARP